MVMKETLEEAAEKYCLINNIPTDQMIVKNNRSCEFETPVTMFINGAKWQSERMLAFINDEDNHTEGELGNSCIDVQTLVNFIKQFKKK